MFLEIIGDGLILFPVELALTLLFWLGKVISSEFINQKTTKTMANNKSNHKTANRFVRIALKKCLHTVKGFGIQTIAGLILKLSLGQAIDTYATVSWKGNEIVIS